MKGIVKSMIIACGELFHYLYPAILSERLYSFRNYFYTGWIKNKFRKFEGKAEYPIIYCNPKLISIGKGTRIAPHARIRPCASFLGTRYSPSIEIGDNCSIGKDCFLSSINKIIVGNNVAITARTLVLDNVHGDFMEKDFTFNNNKKVPDVFLQNVKTRELYSKGPIIIEDDVHIGENCVIMSGITIGHNSVISANTVVIKNIPPYSLVSGNPGKIIMSFGGKDK